MKLYQDILNALIILTYLDEFILFYKQYDIALVNKSKLSKYRYNFNKYICYFYNIKPIFEKDELIENYEKYIFKNTTKNNFFDNKLYLYSSLKFANKLHEQLLILDNYNNNVLNYNIILKYNSTKNNNTFIFKITKKNKIKKLINNINNKKIINNFLNTLNKTKISDDTYIS